MSLPRFLTDTGLGYYRGGLVYAEFDSAEQMLAQYPLANSPLLRKLGADDMLGYLADTWAFGEWVSDTSVRMTFDAADGATSVTDSRGKFIRSMTPEVVFSKLKVGGGEFHPDLPNAADWNGKFMQYNDESLLWQGMYAGMRAKLYERWDEFSSTAPLNNYGTTERDADLLAWECATEGFVKIFNYMHDQLPGSRWAVHLLPARSQTTSSISGQYDHNWGQWTNSSANRWRGVGADAENAAQANAYADFWLNVAEEVYGQVANASGWLCPRLYIDVRMRNWTLEFPDQPTPSPGWNNSTTAALIRESYMLSYSDQVDLCRRMAPDKPLYPAVVPYHVTPGSEITNNTNVQGWFQGMSVDVETHREQMRRILDRCNGVSFWSGEDYNGRVAMAIGRAPADPTDAPANGIWDTPNYDPEDAQGGIIKTRVRMYRRFPHIFGHLDFHPNTPEGEAAWRTPELWAEYTNACMEHLNAMATTSVLLGVAKQSTLTSLIGG